MSRIVTVHRKLAFNHENERELKRWMQGANISIGSYYKGLGSIRIATGLSNTEEDLLLPYILDIPKEDKDFRKQVNLFFVEIDTPVPEEGVKLEIGLEDDEKKLAGDNLPINVEQYVRYRHLLEHPEVAGTEKTGSTNALKRFYIVDSEAIREDKRLEQREIDIALSDYLQLKDDVEKSGMVISLLGETPVRKGIELQLSRLAKDKPKAFHDVVHDKDLHIKYEIGLMVSYTILEKVGTRYLIMESGEEIGGDMKETVLWFKDKKNTREVNQLKARLKNT